MVKNITPLKTPASAEGGEFELVPAGVYLARCFKMIDIGTHDTTWKGKPAGKKRKIILYWELLQNDAGEDGFMEDGERVFSISKEYTWSLGKNANLLADLNSWRGQDFTADQARDFEITKLLGICCKLQVVHKPNADKSRTYANVGAIMTTVLKPKGVNELVSFSIEKPDMELFETFSDYLKDKIRLADEWTTKTKTGTINNEGEVVVEDIDDESETITKEDLNALPF